MLAIEVLGLRDEVSGGVVDQPVERAGRPDAVDHFLHRRRHADVDNVGVDPSSGMPGHDLPGGLLEHGAPPAADHAVGTQLDEALHHDPSQTSAAAADEEALSLE